MKKFKLHRIKYPGRVNLPKLGTIELASISDELAQELFNKGIPYLRPKKPRDKKNSGYPMEHPNPDDDPQKDPDILNDHDT